MRSLSSSVDVKTGLLSRISWVHVVAAHVGPRRVRGAELNQIPTNEERPRRRGLVGERVANGRQDAFPPANLPRSVFWNRASPLAFASSALGSTGFPSSGFVSLVALLFLAFGVMLLFFALMIISETTLRWGWLPSSGGGNHPQLRPGAFRHALSACMSYLAGTRTSSVLRADLS